MRKLFFKKTLVYITTLILFFTVFPSLVLNTIAEDPPIEDPLFLGNEWYVDGNGTYFEITNSSYLNVTLSSSENIHLYLESIPKIISYYIESNCSANSTIITLSNFEVNKTYYIYQDDNPPGQFTPDGFGSYSYTHDLTVDHRISIQEDISTIEIKSDGSIVPSTAPILRVGNTYTLTDNIYEDLRIRKSYITLDGAGYSIQGSGSGYGIDILSQVYITIKNINVNGFSYGIYLNNVDYSTIQNSDIYKNQFGIWMRHNQHNTIIDNIIKSNIQGIYMYRANYNTITNNTISFNSKFGIYLHYYCYYNILNDNTISNDNNGLYLIDYNWYTTITGNLISNNFRGITFLGDYYCTIKFNTISNNNYGVYLSCAREGRFHHNNILYNTKQIYFKSYISYAFWDDGFGEGNYWSDYTGVDDGSNGRTPGDGVGDTLIPHPYTNQGNRYWHLDNYPLMDPWSLNDPPVANANGPYVDYEGNEITFDASGSTDPNNDPLEYRWDFNNDGTWDTTYSTDPTATHTWYDDHSGTTAVEVYDGEYTDIAIATVTVNNVPPNITSLVLPIDPVEISNAVDLTAQFTDPGLLDTHTATINWGDGNTTTGTITGSAGTYDVSSSWTYDQAGVYTITLIIEDDNGGIDTKLFQYVVVYDPSAGFVTGGGWIVSPEGAYTLDPNIAGKANFGFVSKYKQGQPTPSGNTEFNFKMADLNFHSSDYDWLVLAGAKAMYKGTGTINDIGNYGFMLSAIDEDLTPSTDVDLFRIKIWDRDNNDEVIYDNNLGNDDDDDPSTEIGGGNIKIHGSGPHDQVTKTKQKWIIETFINNIKTSYLKNRNNPEELLSNVIQKLNVIQLIFEQFLENHPIMLPLLRQILGQ